MGSVRMSVSRSVVKSSCFVYTTFCLLWLVQRNVLLTLVKILIVVLSVYISLSLLTSLHRDYPRPKRYFHTHDSCRIFMMHVGSPDTLNHFQACSIESAALHHPNFNVCLAIQVTD